MAVFGLGVGVPLAVTAHSASAESNNPKTGIIDKLSQKFNLNKDDVKKVFDEERDSRQAEHQQKFKDKITQLVKDGKISQAQADKITAKQAEMQTFMESLKGKTADERHKAMDAKKTELQAWAKSNGIDEKYLMPGFGNGNGGGPRSHRGTPKQEMN